MSARAHAGDQRINAIRKILQNLLRRGADMGINIGLVFKLLWNPSVWRRGGQLLRTRNRAFHAFFAWRQIKTRTIGQHQTATLYGHAVGHDQNQFVAFDRGDHGQPDAGVARGRLDDGRARLQFATLFSRFNHG